MDEVTTNKRGRRYRNAPVLARWAAKTALMLQGAEPTKNRVVHPSMFPRLMNAGVVPSELRVWIGAVNARGV